jgi:hypothetical protein
MNFYKIVRAKVILFSGEKWCNLCFCIERKNKLFMIVLKVIHNLVVFFFYLFLYFVVYINKNEVKKKFYV